MGARRDFVAPESSHLVGDEVLPLGWDRATDPPAFVALFEPPGAVATRLTWFEDRMAAQWSFGTIGGPPS
jgi:hypothetical protein